MVVESRLMEISEKNSVALDTEGLIFTMRQLQEKNYEFAKDLIMALLGMEKAYKQHEQQKGG